MRRRSGLLVAGSARAAGVFQMTSGPTVGGRPVSKDGVSVDVLTVVQAKSPLKSARDCSWISTTIVDVAGLPPPSGVLGCFAWASSS